MERQKKLYLTSIILAAFYSLEFFVCGIFIFKNLYYTFAAFPFILSAVAVVPLTLSLLNIKFFKSVKLSVAIICLACLLVIAQFLFTAYILSKLLFLLITFVPLFIVLALCSLVLFFTLGYVRLEKKYKRISVIIISVVLLFTIVFGIFEINFFRFTSDGVVFAVEDEYQIAWATSVKSVGYVKIGDKTYYDEQVGQNSVSKLHKICVPMSELDSVKEYSIHSSPVYSEAAYLSWRGRERSKSYTFRPADDSDGIQIYNISDNHECLSGASQAGRYFGDKLDILILNGDNINDVSSYYQISLIYKLASNITGGQIPVIFARGNHDCVGKYADELHRYVGSNDGNFYYTVTLGGVNFVVLDTNNDMSDDNFLISSTANFELVRERQAKWLEELDFNGFDAEYSLLVCHMAFGLADYKRFPDWTQKLNSLTDGKFDLCVSGHSHRLHFAEAGTDTLTSYPIIRGSIRSDHRTDGEGVFPFTFTGTAIECIDGHITAKFTNSKHEVLQEISVL